MHTPTATPTASAEAKYPTAIQPQPSRAGRRTALTDEAGKPPTSTDLRVAEDARHEQWLREQYLRDLETLERIEQQRGEQDPCFFCAHADLVRTQLERTP